MEEDTLVHFGEAESVAHLPALETLDVTEDYHLTLTARQLLQCRDEDLGPAGSDKPIIALFPRLDRLCPTTAIVET